MPQIADDIRYLLDSYDQVIPTVLEVRAERLMSEHVVVAFWPNGSGMFDAMITCCGGVPVDDVQMAVATGDMRQCQRVI